MAKLVIPGTLPNLNDYTRANRSVSRNRNFNSGAKMKRETEEYITVFILQQLRGVSIKKRAKLSFKWYEPNKKRDMDNICFAKKFILDALVRNNVLKTDGWRGVAGFNDEFYISKNNPRIEVEIDEVE